MRIIGLVGKDSGPGFHRVLMPLLLMQGVDARITNHITDEDFEQGCDAIFYNRQVDMGIVDKARSRGAKVVLDVDDYWKLDRHHIAYQSYQDCSFEAIQVRHLLNADIVTTTHERLAEKISKYNSNSVILPNAIPHHEYFPTEHVPGERVRLFWQGSITHEQDLRLLNYPIKGIYHDKELREKVMMAICGYTKHKAWDEMVSVFTNNLKLKGAVLPGASPFEYYSNYQFADICLAPLLSTPFNALKSNLKVLEAAHMSLPVIASAVHPYLRMPVLYAAKSVDWLNHIRDLVNDPVMRAELGQKLKAFCHQHHNFDQINLKRKELFV